MTQIDIKKYPNLRLGKKSSENNELLTELIEKYNTHDTGKAELISGSGAPASLLPENTIYKDTATGDLYLNVDGVNKKYVGDSSLVKEIVWDVDLPTSGGASLSTTLIANTTGYDGLSIIDQTLGPNLALEFKGPAADLTDKLRGIPVIGRSLLGGIAGIKAIPNPPSYSFDSGLYITKCDILLYDSSDVLFTAWPEYAVKLLLRFKLYP